MYTSPPLSLLPPWRLRRETWKEQGRLYITILRMTALLLERFQIQKINTQRSVLAKLRHI